MERSRHRALVIATAALAAGLLTACGAGFDATAIQPYSPSDGTMANTGDIRIQNALVVASPTVSTGVIVASIANGATATTRSPASPVPTAPST